MNDGGRDGLMWWEFVKGLGWELEVGLKIT